MESESGVGPVEDATFAQTLAELKRQGSNILLVGDVESAGRGAACQRLLGDSTADERFRLFVLTGEAEHEVPAETIDEGESERSVITLQSVDDEGDRTFPADVSVSRTTMLGMLGTKVVERINGFERDADGLDPAALRVCVDSVDELLEGRREENVFRLLHVLTTRVRRANGMGHYHFAVDRDHEAVRLFEPLFDAVVEVRTGDDEPKHRWYLRDSDTTSDWVTI